MAKNQRQRRPLQDDTRTNKKTVRERAQVSKRQRERIEENRDRRERRREREQARRKTVDSIRSPKEDLRTYRMESRLIPVEDTFLGTPVGTPRELPVVIGERWNMENAAQVVTDSTWEDVEFDTSAFTTERNGFPALYNTSTRKFTIPGGLSGVWQIVFNGTFLAVSGAAVSSQVLQNGLVIAFCEHSTTVASQSVPLNVVFYAYESDYFQVQVIQFFGSDRNLASTAGYCNVELIFLGK